MVWTQPIHKRVGLRDLISFVAPVIAAFNVSPERWPRVSALFDHAIELTPEERAAFIARLRDEDATLAADVGALLVDVESDADQNSKHATTLNPPTAARGLAFATLLSEALAEKSSPRSVGERFGAWTTVSLIGRGGMGEVWLARRDDGLFKGDAAIKLLRSDLPAARLAERFARERSVLARLNHPNIARLLDAGVGGNDGAQAYLVLELVEGAAFEAYLRDNTIDVERRVSLVRDVANAVAYAHSQLVLHRDLKPNNVLVDRQGHAKLLDFGIAAEIDDVAEAQTASQLTQHTGRGLALEYAAPEQLVGDATSAASDTYSLGALLYFALCGEHPFAEHTNRAALNRAVMEQTPMRVRQRLRTKEGAVQASAVDEDLDAIIAKALRKAPLDRYQTAQSFAADLDAWLTRQPISIRADDRSYRLRLWFARNRAFAVAASIAAIAVLAGAGTSLVQRNDAIAQAFAAEQARAEALHNEKRATSALADLARQIDATEAATRNAVAAQAAAESARQRAELALNAEQRAATAARSALERAERDRKLSDATSQFVTGLFEAADPERALGEKLTAFAVLDAGSKTLDTVAQTDPQVAANLGSTLGRVFNHLSRPDRAIPLLEQSLALAEKQHGRSSTQAIMARYEYARALERKERFADAIPHYRELIALPDRAPISVKQRAFSRIELAFSLGKLGRFDEADAVLRELEKSIDSLPKDDWLRVEAVAARAVQASMRGQWQETYRLYSSVSDRIAVPPPGHARDSLLMRFGYATSSLATGNPEAAAALFPPLHAEAERLLGSDSNETLQFLWHVGFTERNAWKLRECITTYDRAFEGRTRTSGAAHALTLDAGLWAATCRAYDGELDTARSALSRFIPVLLSVSNVGRSDLRNLLTASMLALQIGAIVEAERLLGALDAAIEKLNLRQSVESVRADLLGVLLLHARDGDLTKTRTALDAMMSKRENTPTAALVRSNFEVFSTKTQLAALQRDCDGVKTHGTAARAALIRRSGSKHPHIAELDRSIAQCQARAGALSPAAIGIL
jgi:eukaryotic-like serine/threonine-protein kinase